MIECTGCGRKSTDPKEDLAFLKRTGFLSCCPERVMKVRIQRCADPKMWYRDLVGQLVEVQWVDRDGLWAWEKLINNIRCINVIRFSDVEL